MGIQGARLFPHMRNISNVTQIVSVFTYLHENDLFGIFIAANESAQIRETPPPGTHWGARRARRNWRRRRKRNSDGRERSGSGIQICYQSDCNRLETGFHRIFPVTALHQYFTGLIRPGLILEQTGLLQEQYPEKACAAARV